MRSGTRYPALLLAFAAIAGCSTIPTPTASPPIQSVPTERPATIEVAAVSRSQPGAEAAAVFRKCQIGETIRIDLVSGMGKLPTTADLVRFVPLTGREPQLRSPGAAWVIQIRGDVPQYKSGETWTNPTCVVTDEIFGYFATGPVKNLSTGNVHNPEPPAIQPDLTLPALAP